MENLRQKFLDEAVSSLENICSKLSAESFDENFSREIFRAFHTLKGTSQTFNFNAAGKLAHELENLLQAAKDRKIQPDKNFTALLLEGAEILRATFRRARDGAENRFPNEFVEKLRASIPNYSASFSEDFFDDIPPEILERLSAEEKKSLSSAIAGGKSFYSIEVAFDLNDFDEKFRLLRDALQDGSEIIATFPHAAHAEKNKIGFRLFFASRKSADEIAKLVKSFETNLTSYNFGANFKEDLQGVLAQAVLTGEKIARRLNKKVEFETFATETEISGKLLKLISDSLLHLIRNAVDHAIETKGKIKIEILPENKHLILRVADDGRGLDAQKIKAAAIEKKLIASHEILTRAETFDLIFAHGFSTAETVSEISGRGIGLDAVKDSVERAGGKIRVTSESGKGTIFEISLPKDEAASEK
ncbi:MAG: chemotaxis protein CheA [Pyrinomonadaceae bacterium]